MWMSKVMSCRKRRPGGLMCSLKLAMFASQNHAEWTMWSRGGPSGSTVSTNLVPRFAPSTCHAHAIAPCSWTTRRRHFHLCACMHTCIPTMVDFIVQIMYMLWSIQDIPYLRAGVETAQLLFLLSIAYVHLVGMKPMIVCITYQHGPTCICV
jgi:hypothetical protein